MPSWHYIYQVAALALRVDFDAVLALYLSSGRFSTKSRFRCRYEEMWLPELVVGGRHRNGPSCRVKVKFHRVQEVKGQRAS